MITTIKSYLNLIKPGIVIGNVISSIGGFLMASHGRIDYYIFINTIIGISLIIASSCVFNNIIDRDIDSIMQRTQHRVLVQQNSISIKSSIFYAIILNIFGFLVLSYIKNLLIIFLTIIGFVIYIGIYSLWLKRKSIYSINIGSISGSMPPVIGYCAVTHQLDLGALVLLMIFTFWQIPHSYSIGIMQSHDYKIASIPTFFLIKGINKTRIHMILYILGFSCSTIALSIMGFTSYKFLYIICAINLLWLYIGIFQYQSINNYIIWSKKMFILSIITIMSLNILLSLDSLIF